MVLLMLIGTAMMPSRIGQPSAKMGVKRRKRKGRKEPEEGGEGEKNSIPLFN